MDGAKAVFRVVVIKQVCVDELSQPLLLLLVTSLLTMFLQNNRILSGSGSSG